LNEETTPAVENVSEGTLAVVVENFNHFLQTILLVYAQGSDTEHVMYRYRYSPCLINVGRSETIL
jgi:hypothetical protein